MRLIDADALKEEICKRYFHFSQRLKISPVLEAITKAHSIDAVPAREGRWLFEKINEDEYGVEQFAFICSECGVPAYEFSQPYCHRCGAKMKKFEKREE